MNDMIRMELGGKRLLINLLKISLLAFTGFRTYHFLTTTLPSDAFIVAIFGLAAIDLGVVLWESYYNHGALSAEQETIAGGMIILDLIGMACAFAGDVLLIRTDVVAPVWRCPIAAYGPGDSALDHTPEERLGLDEFLVSVRVLAEAIPALARELSGSRTEASVTV